MKKFTLAVGLLTVLSTTAMAQQTTQSRPTSQPGRPWQHLHQRHDQPQQWQYDKFRHQHGHECRQRAQRGSPEGSPAAAPKGITGPNGQPFKQRDAAQVVGL